MKIAISLLFILQNRFNGLGIGQLDVSKQDTWRWAGGFLIFVLLFYFSWYKRRNNK